MGDRGSESEARREPDPSGGYGHPDHIAVCELVTAAVRRTGGSSHDHRLVLYYTCFPRGVYRPMWEEMVALGITPPFGGNSAETVKSPDDAVTAVVDVTGHVDAKNASLKRHRSQLSAAGPLYRRELRRTLGREYFALASPGAAGDLLSAWARADIRKPGDAFRDEPMRTGRALSVEGRSRSARGRIRGYCEWALDEILRMRSPREAWRLCRRFLAGLGRRSRGALCVPTARAGGKPERQGP